MGTPDAVEEVGTGAPKAAGNPPPMATSRMMKKPWSVALAQVVGSTWLAFTREVGAAVDEPADLVWHHALVQFHPVGVEAGLAPGADAFPAADTSRLVARPTRADTAVQRGEQRAASVDVLHDVDLAHHRPVVEDATKGRPQHPERGPVARGRRAAHVGLLQRGFHSQRAAGRRLEVGALRLDAAGGPLTVRAAHRADGPGGPRRRGRR